MLKSRSRSRSSHDGRGGHAHCDSCYTRRCRAQASVCCPLSSCRLLCGALFHLCKEEDHLLLCPNVRVPCINSEYGCPLQMPRLSRAEHLQYCPASVVSCSMEWNRWPAQDAYSYQNTELHENLIQEKANGGCLDLALALKDQERLFHSLKMKKLFPEMTQRVHREAEEEQKKKEKEKQKKARIEKETATKQTWQTFNKYHFPVNTTNDNYDDGDEDDDFEEVLQVQPEQELTQAEREAIAFGSTVNPELLEKYNAWERMFSMEMGGCREAREANSGPDAAKGKSLGALVEEDESKDVACSGTTSGYRQTSAPVPTACALVKNKSFFYGHVEPMKIITVRTFKIPTSFAARPCRIRNPGFYRRKSKAVDTSDLGVALQDMPLWEEIQASLLCSLEKEQRGHMIAESVSADTLLQDEGTQTYNFLSAPFHSNTSLWDLAAAKPLELHLQLQVESVTNRHHKASSAFTFLCGHNYQRREYGQHYKNIHCDIHMCVNGWFEQRCPLAYLGCTYSRTRFQPSTHEATVSYYDELGCFSLRPTITLPHGDTSLSSSSSWNSVPQRRRGRGAAGGDDPLSSLPYEVLCHVASFLDSLSLSQLSLVSRLMRQVCSSQLQDRGMVTLRWDRKTYSNGTAKWRVTHHVWEFSTLFSPVNSWCFRDVPPMSAHLRVCPYYDREARTEKVLLPKIREQVCNDTNCKERTLVNLFKRNTVIM